jgi:hypothetical protein
MGSFVACFTPIGGGVPRRSENLNFCRVGQNAAFAMAGKSRSARVSRKLVYRRSDTNYRDGNPALLSKVRAIDAPSSVSDRTPSRLPRSRHNLAVHHRGTVSDQAAYGVLAHQGVKLVQLLHGMQQIDQNFLGEHDPVNWHCH